VAEILARLADPARSPLAPREQLSRLLFDGELTPAEAARARDALSALNDRLVFGPVALPEDPHVAEYRIQRGDILSRLPRRLGWEVGWRVVAEVSDVRNPARLQVGQRIKGLVGPFHAVVTKRAHRLDVWMGDLAVAPIYVTSWPVGLGADDRTPTGRWRVRSKDLNPAWIDPETGERFSRDDPLNPIGEAWIGLRGIDPLNADLDGYGIHGTIEPETIGTDASLGCVRLHHEEVLRLHELLGDESLIVIRTSDDEPIAVP
jgi:lipoprotein-anchoring transpeptidase ErfK/SrfK